MTLYSYIREFTQLFITFINVSHNIIYFIMISVFMVQVN